MANKHRVEHDGLVFKRESASRTYSHVVLRPCSLAKNLAYAENSARYSWKENQEFHQCASKGEPAPGYSYSIDAEDMARSQAWLAKGEAGLVAEAREYAERRWREQFPERDEAWSVMGWASRLDLAQKQARPGDVILEAVKL